MRRDMITGSSAKDLCWCHAGESRHPRIAQQCRQIRDLPWIPAFAGMTGKGGVSPFAEVHVTIAALLFLLLSLTVFSTSAIAQENIREVTLHGKSLKLKPPQGMCFLDENNPDHKLLLEFFRNSSEGINRLVAGFADCTALQNKKTAKSYGAVFSPIAPATASSRDEYLTGISNELKRQSNLLSDGSKDATTQIRQLVENTDTDSLRVGKTKVLGVFAESADMVQLGILQKQQIGDKIMVMAGTVGMTMIAGLPLSINIYGDYDSPQIFAGLKDDAANYGAALIGLNEKIDLQTDGKAANTPAKEEETVDNNRTLLAYGIYGGALLILGFLLSLLLRPRK